MRYRRLPYAARYLVALFAWLALFALALILKFAFIYFLPFLWLMSGMFNRDQQSAQLGANLVDFYLYCWPPFPRADWRKLLGRRDSADQPAHPRLVQEVGNRRA